MIVARSKKGAFDPVGFAVFAILLIAVAYPITKNVIDNQSLTGTDALVAGAALTLMIVLLVVKIAQAMKAKM